MILTRDVFDLNCSIERSKWVTSLVVYRNFISPYCDTCLDWLNQKHLSIWHPKLPWIGQRVKTFFFSIYTQLYHFTHQIKKNINIFIILVVKKVNLFRHQDLWKLFKKMQNQYLEKYFNQIFASGNYWFAIDIHL